MQLLSAPPVVRRIHVPERSWDRRTAAPWRPALAETNAPPTEPVFRSEAIDCWSCSSCDELRQRVESLVYEATHDALTGLRNRRGLFGSVPFQAGGVGLGVIYIDLDGVKAVNDQYGHDAGDDIIASTASLLRTTLRFDDVVARIGGDEFAIALPDQDETSLMSIVTRLREQFDGQRCFSEQWSTPLFASIGAAIGQPGEAAAEVMSRADAAMYTQKSRRAHRSSPKRRPALIVRERLDTAPHAPRTRLRSTRN